MEDNLRANALHYISEKFPNEKFSLLNEFVPAADSHPGTEYIFVFQSHKDCNKNVMVCADADYKLTIKLTDSWMFTFDECEEEEEGVTQFAMKKADSEFSEDYHIFYEVSHLLPMDADEIYESTFECPLSKKEIRAHFRKLNVKEYTLEL